MNTTKYAWINAMAERLHEMLPRLGVEAESKGKILNFTHSFWYLFLHVLLIYLFGSIFLLLASFSHPSLSLVVPFFTSFGLNMSMKEFLISVALVNMPSVFLPILMNRTIMQPVSQAKIQEINLDSSLSHSAHL